MQPHVPEAERIFEVRFLRGGPEADSDQRFGREVSRHSQETRQEYEVDEYIRGRLDFLVREMDQLFPAREKSTQSELTDFAQDTPTSPGPDLS